MRSTRTTLSKSLLALSLVLLVAIAGVGVAHAVPQGPGDIQNAPNDEDPDPEPQVPPGPQDIQSGGDGPPPPEPPPFEDDQFTAPTPCTHGCGPEGDGVDPGDGSGSDAGVPAPEAADPAVEDAPSTDDVEITMLGRGEPRETSEVAAGTELTADSKSGLPAMLWALVAVLLAAAAGLWLVIIRRRRDDDTPVAA
jgi:hypothetical protein